jgi:DNA-binding beta-propeller fold protein YncE
MNTRKAFITLGLLLALVMMLPYARASERDQATAITFNQSVQIPGRVLPAGTYWFVVSEANTSRNIVQIFNSDRSKLFATVLTINTESLTTTDKSAITFAEREPMQPQTILSWFYPGHTPGHQFVYSNMEQQELAQVKHYTLMVKAQNKHQIAAGGD